LEIIKNRRSRFASLGDRDAATTLAKRRFIDDVSTVINART
jgi:hypothetical protein